MKKILSLLLSLITIFMFGCGNSNIKTKDEIKTEEKISINLGLPKAAPALAVLQMIETNAMGDDVEINIDYWDSPEQLIAMTQDEEHDMFALPLTVAGKLYNKGVDIKLTNVNTWGITYCVTSDENIKEWSDLKGKTIYVPLKSSPPDIVLKYFLNANGINPDEDVTLQYASTSEVAQLIKSGQAEYGVLLEPQVTNCIKGNDKLRVAFSYDEEWKKVMNDKEKTIPNAGFGVSGEFINSNPQIVKKFEEEYEKALNYLLENPETAGKLAENNLGMNKDITADAMSRIGLMYKSAVDSIDDLNDFYKVLYDFDPSTIGGNIPGED
ncbi:ABC transporter substrate-binding protein, partial [uncultured Clostridium sp.]|uniref:ABC transporter substrate-binding protein n=1 Tax=uncultured Clostridium sp. TaxID=59620 RepID=UPI0025FF26F8